MKFLILMLLSLPCYAQQSSCEDPYWPNASSNPTYIQKTKNFKGTLISDCFSFSDLTSDQSVELLQFLFLTENKDRTILSGPLDKSYTDGDESLPATFFVIQEQSDTEHGKLSVISHVWLIPGENPRYIARSKRVQGQGRARYTTKIGVDITLSLDSDTLKRNLSYQKTLQVRKPSIAPKSLFMSKVEETFLENFVLDRDLMIEQIEIYLKTFE